MADWNTRLEVKLGDSTITPISSFSPTFNVPHTVIHSLESDEPATPANRSRSPSPWPFRQ